MLNNRAEPQAGVSIWKILLEGVLGVVVGFTLGAILYYALVIAFAEVIAAAPAKTWLDFNPAMVIVLAVIATVLEIGLYRLLCRCQFRVFARLQTVAGMLSSLSLFIITAARHNPLLPFYGQ